MKFNDICILGGSGFVGHHIVERLAETGHRIKVLTRTRERHRDLLVIPGIDLVEADIHDPAQLARHISGSDAVINLVGIVTERGYTGMGFRAVQVDLVNKLIRACQAKGIGRLLQMSALGADAARGSSYYLRSKGEAEDLIAVASKHSMQTTVFRPSLIFGPGDHCVNRFARMVRHAPGILPVPCARTQVSPVYAGDVAEAVVRALNDQQTFGKTFDLCGPHTYTLGELFRYLGEVTGHHPAVVELGPGMSHLMAFISEWLPGKPFTVDHYKTLLGELAGRPDGFKAFGIRPTPLEAIAPLLLGHDQRSHYNALRRSAGRA